MKVVSMALNSFPTFLIFLPVWRTVVAISSVSVMRTPLLFCMIESFFSSCACEALRMKRENKQSRHILRMSMGCIDQSLLRIRSITQLVGVELMPSQVQIAFPCKCSTTALIRGSCTWGGFSGRNSSRPFSVCRAMGS